MAWRFCIKYIGHIFPQHYDRNLGPVLFRGLSADISRRVAACSPPAGVEIAGRPPGSLRSVLLNFPACQRTGDGEPNLNPPSRNRAGPIFCLSEVGVSIPAGA